MKIIDNFTSKEFIAEFREWLSTQVLFHGWKAHKDSDGSFWHKNFVLEAKYNHHYAESALNCDLSYERLMLESSPMSSLTRHISAKYFNGKQLTRIWANVQAYGDEAAIHHDFPAEYRGKSQTLVWYPLESWDPDWAGDFVLMDDDKEIVNACSIKPDRALIFDGTFKHAARPISRYCNSLRISIAFGLEDIT